MSADLMLTCEKKNESFEGDSTKCVCVDETGMGQPHTEFGVMFVWNKGKIIDKKMIERAKIWFRYLDHKDYLDIKKITNWLEEHVGEKLENECW